MAAGWRQATAEQIRLAQMIYDKNDTDFEDKVKQLMEVTGKTQDECIVALHDCNGDMNRAINILLEGSSDTSDLKRMEWTTIKETGLQTVGNVAVGEQAQNPSHPGILEVITNWPAGENFRLISEDEEEKGYIKHGKLTYGFIHTHGEDLQDVYLKPMKVHRRAETHLQPVEDPMLEQGLDVAEGEEQGGLQPKAWDYMESSATDGFGTKSEIWETGQNDADDGTGRSGSKFPSPGPYESDFYHPSIFWKDNTTAGYKQSKSLQDYADDNFLLQVIEEPTRRGAMLDLVLTNKKGLVGNVKLKGSLGCSDHEMVEFENFRAATRRMHNKLTTLYFRRADFGPFGDLLGRVSWDKALEGRSKRTG
ncbi:hypothetical protein TURU_013821 [Turdus rufiventris]|nr:hypothetical protein TURU_013821 [Turdus rufiventris]